MWGVGRSRNGRGETEKIITVNKPKVFLDAGFCHLLVYVPCDFKAESWQYWVGTLPQNGHAIGSYYVVNMRDILRWRLQRTQWNFRHSPPSQVKKESTTFRRLNSLPSAGETANRGKRTLEDPSVRASITVSTKHPLLKTFYKKKHACIVHTFNNTLFRYWEPIPQQEQCARIFCTSCVALS
jgi:hypothetical protein